MVQGREGEGLGGDDRGGIRGVGGMIVSMAFETQFALLRLLLKS